MSVFEIFAREKRELSNSDITRLLQVADSSCSDMLYTLQQCGYLARTLRTRRFYPTRRLYEIAGEISANDPLASIAQEAVDELAEKTHESCFFGIEDRLAVKIIAARQSRLPLRYVLEVGERIALHASAIGKAILGQLSPQEAADKVKGMRLIRVTARTITGPDELLADLKQGRRRGWFEARSEGAEDVTALGVTASLGDQVVGISLAGPAARIEKNRAAYVSALLHVKAALAQT
jgi:DNA-binding IclR family transcriptional regulator